MFEAFQERDRFYGNTGRGFGDIKDGSVRGAPYNRAGFVTRQRSCLSVHGRGSRHYCTRKIRGETNGVDDSTGVTLSCWGRPKFRNMKTYDKDDGSNLQLEVLQKCVDFFF